MKRSVFAKGTIHADRAAFRLLHLYLEFSSRLEWPDYNRVLHHARPTLFIGCSFFLQKTLLDCFWWCKSFKTIREIIIAEGKLWLARRTSAILVLTPAVLPASVGQPGQCEFSSPAIVLITITIFNVCTAESNKQSLPADWLSPIVCMRSSTNARAQKKNTKSNPCGL